MLWRIILYNLGRSIVMNLMRFELIFQELLLGLANEITRVTMRQPHTRNKHTKMEIQPLSFAEKFVSVIN